MEEVFKAERVSSGRASFFTLLELLRSCYIYIGDQKIQGYAGDLILLKKNIVFKADEPDAFLACYFNSDLFDSLFYAQIADCRILYDFMIDDAKRDEYLYYSVHASTSVHHMLDVLREESRYEDLYHTKMIRLLLVGIFTLLDRHHDETLIVNKSTMISDNRFGRIMKYLGEHFRTATLQSTAERFGYNPDYLSTRFKKITGETFRHKLLTIRLEKAADLLLATEMTVDQIADTVGFHDKSWFMKKFKERYGMTPKAYRKNHS